MSIKTIFLGVIVDDEASSAAAIEYAVALCDLERAHLSCRIAAPTLDIPTARILPLVHALSDQVNADRLAKANETQLKIETAARLSGVPLDCRIVQASYADARDALVAAARASDLVVLSQDAGPLSAEAGIIDRILFASGRPVLVVPPDWAAPPAFRRIAVAWDGGQRAARAVGDALPLLARADEVEVMCVVAEGDASAAGADLAEHLARHCRKLHLIDLPIAHADAGRTVREHVSATKPDLLVMGAYGHSRLLQFVLGGVTRTMLEEANLPVFYSG